MRAASHPLTVFSLPGGMKMGVHGSKASALSSRWRLRSRAASSASAIPVQSRGLSKSSSASLSWRAATRARAAALDCGEHSGKHPNPHPAAVAGKDGRPVRSVRVSVIWDCHPLLRPRVPPQTTSEAFRSVHILQAPPCSCGQKDHSGSLALCGQSTAPPR